MANYRMEMKQNPDTKDWLCYIQGTGQAYYYKFKRDAIKFCKNVNEDLEAGNLYFDSENKLRARR